MRNEIEYMLFEENKESSGILRNPQESSGMRGNEERDKVHGMVSEENKESSGILRKKAQILCCSLFLRPAGAMAGPKKRLK